MEQFDFIGPDLKRFRRGLVFSVIYLAATLVATVYYPLACLLIPFGVYHVVYARRALTPGNLGIQLHADHLVVLKPFSKPVTVWRKDVGLFVPVQVGKGTAVVARREDAIEKRGEVLPRAEASDTIMPSWLLPESELAERLEAWRRAG
jgi:hypothetical protein